MACYNTVKRRANDLRSLAFDVPAGVAKHIARCAVESDMGKAEWMTRTLSAGQPFPSLDSSDPTETLRD